jgi:hypothetical protein
MRASSPFEVTGQLDLISAVLAVKLDIRHEQQSEQHDGHAANLSAAVFRHPVPKLQGLAHGGIQRIRGGQSPGHDARPDNPGVIGGPLCRQTSP